MGGLSRQPQSSYWVGGLLDRVRLVCMEVWLLVLLSLEGANCDERVIEAKRRMYADICFKIIIMCSSTVHARCCIRQRLAFFVEEWQLNAMTASIVVGYMFHVVTFMSR